MTNPLRSFVFSIVFVGPLLGQQPLFAPELILDAQHSILTTVDLDADGDRDLIVLAGSIQGGLQTLELYRNPGNAIFQGVAPIPLATLPSGFTGAIATGDFNGDGFFDLVLGFYSSSPLGLGIRIYPGTGGTTVGAAQFIPTAGWPSLLQSRRRPGDALDDLVIGLGTGNFVSPAAIQVQWLEFTPISATFGTPTILPTGNFVGIESIACLDVTGDGLDDVVVVIPIGGIPGPTPISVLQTVGTNFVPGTPLPSQILWRGLPAPLDIDADGDQDLAIANTNGANWLGLVVLRNDGPLGFSAQTIPGNYIDNSLTSPTIRVGDLDADGRDEVIISGGATSNQTAAKFVIYANDGTGVLGYAAKFSSFTFGRLGSVAIEDLDNDGDDDLVGVRDLLLSPGAVFVPPPSPTYYGASGTADIDGDGDQDAFFGSALGIDYALNDGTGAAVFPPGSPNGLGMRTQSLIPAPTYFSVTARLDMNGDGWLDALIQVNTGVSFTNRIYLGGADLALRDAGPTFAIAGIAAEPLDAKLADIDGDGTRDLVYRSGIALGIPGAVNFIPLVINLGGHTIADVADIDADGDPDLLALRIPPSGPSYLGIFRNDGNFSLSLQSIPIPNLLFSPMFSDMDGDGDLDIVAARNAGAQYEALVLVNLNGGLGALVTAPIGPPPTASTATSRLLPPVDLDLDGRKDIVFLDAADGSMALRFIPGTGPGPSFGTVRTFATDYGVLSDVDGDGDHDFVAVSLIPNTTRFGATAGRRIQYGAGTSGSGGFAPLLGAAGPFRTGQTVVLRARGALGGAPALLTLGTTPVTLPNFLLPGVTTLVWPWVAAVPIPAIGGANLVPGAGSLDLSFSIPPSLALTTVVAQFAFADPQGASGLTVTNGVEVRFGL